VTVLSPGKGTGLNYARASQKTVVSPDGGTGFIDGVWHGPTAWQCQCGKAYTVTCISSKPTKREWVGLTDEEVSYFRYAATFCDELDTAYMAELIEQALKEKNKW
jgi:hypothetical protein